MARSLKSKVFHLIHCAALTGTIVGLMAGTNNSIASETEDSLSSWEEYGFLLAGFLYFNRILMLLCLPLTLFNFLGLVLFNAFPDQAKTKVTRKFVFIIIVTKV